MPVVRSFVCPDCRRQFDHLFTDREPDPPDYCPRCGSYVGDDPQPELSAPAIGGSDRAKAIDAVPRAMEAASLVRQEMAAEAAGVDRSEMAALKVTDVKTGLKPGEAAHQMPLSAVGAVMDQNARKMSFNPAGAEYAAATRVGPGAGAGERSRLEVVTNHHRVAAQAVAAGNMGVHRGKGRGA